METTAHKPYVQTISRGPSPRWMALVFALGITVAGMVDALICVSVQPDAAGSHAARVYPPLWPPDWFFSAVWLVIYPCWGVAVWCVWRQRHETDLRLFTGFFVVTIALNLAFLPISALTHGNAAVLSVMDASALVTVPLTVWLYGRHAQQALWWLLPMLIWGPVTLLLKLWLWRLNRG